MQKEKLILKNETGLHARPASIFVDKAGQFTSDIKIASKGKVHLKKLKELEEIEEKKIVF